MVHRVTSKTNIQGNEQLSAVLTKSWKIPPNGLESIAQQMTQSIEGRVDDVIWEIQKRRRSDSNGLSSLTKEDGWGVTKQDITERKRDFDLPMNR